MMMLLRCVTARNTAVRCRKTFYNMLDEYCKTKKIIIFSNIVIDISVDHTDNLGVGTDPL